MGFRLPKAPVTAACETKPTYTKMEASRLAKHGFFVGLSRTGSASKPLQTGLSR